ncbi:MAG TPA: hypothetical protein VNM14_23685 [Planctomycetota bacterium]|nr:hypothetical protein [Planctomycetota bacterium]
MTCPSCGGPLAGERCDACAPSAADPPPRRGRHRLPLSGLSGTKPPTNWKLLAISLGIAALATGLIVWFASTVAEQMAGGGDRTFDGDEVVLPPGKEVGQVVTHLFSTSYTLTAAPIDGRVVMLVLRLGDGDGPQRSPEAIQAALKEAPLVEAGQSKTLGGQMDRGRHLWLVTNPTDKKVRVRVTFR